MVPRMLRLALCAVLVSTGYAADLAIGDLEEIPAVRKDGEMVAREVSGGTWHDGAMWIVDNEDDRNLLVMADGKFSPRVLPKDLAISDLEGITSDGTHLYVMAGGGLSKKGEVDPRRFTLTRLKVSGGQIRSGVVLDMLPWMKRLAKEIGADLARARDDDGEKVKVVEDWKPEGLAYLPDGRLIVGIRKPLVKDKSAIVSLTAFAEGFEARDPERVKPEFVGKLDCGGSGISSLEWDPVTRSLLVLSIESSKHRTDVWTWNFEKLTHHARLRGHKCEGIARVGRTGQVLILADDEDPDESKHGRYALIEMR